MSWRRVRRRLKPALPPPSSKLSLAFLRALLLMLAWNEGSGVFLMTPLTDFDCWPRLRALQAARVHCIGTSCGQPKESAAAVWVC